MPFPNSQRVPERSTRPALRQSRREEPHAGAAFSRKLQGVLDDPKFLKGPPSVLAAHLSVAAGNSPALSVIGNRKNLVLSSDAHPAGVRPYVALGHIHKPQFLGGNATVQYAAASNGWIWAEK